MVLLRFLSSNMFSWKRIAHIVAVAFILFAHGNVDRVVHGIDIPPFCSWFLGGDATDEFCQQEACAKYCALDALPHYCMEVNYINWGHCVQIGGFPMDYCSEGVTGIRPEHVYWCQTVACTNALLQCLESGETDCYNRVGDWITLDFAPFCKPIESTSSTTPAPAPTTAPPVTTTKSKKKCSTKTKTSPTVSPTTSSLTAAPTTTSTTTSSSTTQGGGEGGCFAPGGWQGQPCAKCPAPSGGGCPAFQWTDCYSSMDECNRQSAGGGNCAKTCPENTLSMVRPTFKGASCYTTEYGGSFGPSWKPTGKTAFERLISSATVFHSMIQTVDDDVPWLQKTWNLKGCDAAAAVYENVVCALELLESLNREFEGPKNGGPGNKITEFANSGDTQTNLREVAAFFSHKFKETGRLMTWEEQASGYADPNAEYPPYPGASYHGRGPVQLSWNYNYGPFSEWFYKDKNVLLQNPDKVDPEGPMGFIAAFWFWFTPRDFTSGAPISGSIRTRDAIIHWRDNKMNSIYNDGVNYDAVAGLGLSTNVINGGIECTGSGDSANWRLGYFLTVASRIKVDIPDINNAAACKADKYCNGLTAGCSSSARAIICEPKDTTCGPAYVSGWSSNLCRFA